MAVCGSREGDIDHPRGHGWPTLVQRQAAPVRLDMGVGVGGKHLPQRVQEPPAEVAHAGKALTELLVQPGPRDELRFAARCSR